MKTSLSLALKNLFLLFLLVASPTQGQDLETRIREVENGLTFPSIVEQGVAWSKGNIYQKLKDYKVHGASVAVIHNGKLDWSRAYGWVDESGRDAVVNTTLFQSASIGKVITALAALKLVELGGVDLDEPVNPRLKRWQLQENEFTRKQAVTLRHLLSHSAGLTDDYGFPGYRPTDELPGLEQILNSTSPSNVSKKLEVKTVPGSVERYSGAGYLIIQMLIEDVSGIPFEEFVETHVFQPAQMTHTTYDYRPDLDPGRSVASGHRANGKSLKSRKYNLYPEKAAAGPWTTAEDLAKLVLAIQEESHPIIGGSLNGEFLRPQIENKGLGVNLKGLEAPEAFWHAGQNLGYMGLFYGLVNKGEGAVILINSDGGERFLQEFITSVAMAYDWPVMNAYQALEINETLLAGIPGTYEDRNQEKGLIIERRKNNLYVIPRGSKKGVVLYRIGENQFTFKDAQDYYRLVFSYTGETATGLTYTESIGKTIELTKLP